MGLRDLRRAREIGALAIGIRLQPLVESALSGPVLDGFRVRIYDATAGAHFGDDWMVLAQAYGGEADDGGPRWLSVETSAVRRYGDWRLQAGWRQAVAGRETPESGGPVLALWRRF